MIESGDASIQDDFQGTNDSDESDKESELNSEFEATDSDESIGEFEVELEDTIIPEKLASILNMTMFYQSGITVQDAYNMVQALYLRYNLSKSVRHGILEMVKLLAGPDFDSLNVSEHFMQKVYNLNDDKKYTFFFVKTAIFRLHRHWIKKRLKETWLFAKSVRKNISYH